MQSPEGAGRLLVPSHRFQERGNEVTSDDRTAAALERIATALEQMALERVPPLSAPFVMAPPDDAPWPTTPPADLPPTSPTAPLSQTVALPPVQPFQFTPPAPMPPGPAARWAAGMNHAAGHKPLKENSRGLYCPTRLQDGTYCTFAVKP